MTYTQSVIPVNQKDRSFTDAVFREPIELIKAQPHQALLSTGSVAIMAQFAAHGGIVNWAVGYLIAIGVEWAYLRGLASDSRARSGWGAALNWSAFGIVVLWGILWVATIYGAIPEKPRGALAYVLAAAHIIPIAWVALCSAQCHRQMLMAENITRLADEQHEKDRAAAMQAERDAMVLEREKKEQDLLLWQKAQEVKQALKKPKSAVPMTSERPPCPECGDELTGTDYALYKSCQSRNARFRGCRQCREGR